MFLNFVFVDRVNRPDQVDWTGQAVGWTGHWTGCSSLVGCGLDVVLGDGVGQGVGIGSLGTGAFW